MGGGGGEGDGVCKVAREKVRDRQTKKGEKSRPGICRIKRVRDRQTKKGEKSRPGICRIKRQSQLYQLVPIQEEQQQSSVHNPTTTPHHPHLLSSQPAPTLTAAPTPPHANTESMAVKQKNRRDRERGDKGK